MEAEGMASEASWSSFYPAVPSVDESEVMTHLFNEQDHDQNIGAQSMFWSDHSFYQYSSSENASCNPSFWSQGNSNAGLARTASLFYNMPADSQNYYLSDANCVSVMNFNSYYNRDEQTGQMINSPSFPIRALDHFGEQTCNMNGDASSTEEAGDSIEKPPIDLLHPNHPLHCSKRKLSAQTTEAEDSQIENPKKKTRSSLPVPKKGRTAKNHSSSNEAESNADLNAQSSSSCCSEDDCNASADPNATSSSSKGNGKTRAGKGSATDPQSLYARKRRERINERLRILQNLVPNGTKVDISTMLEEAVQYVKFLQLQIKLLSSDELWMYAPIAYNGMNIGLNLNIFPASQIPNNTNTAMNTSQLSCE